MPTAVVFEWQYAKKHIIVMRDVPKGKCKGSALVICATYAT